MSFFKTLDTQFTTDDQNEKFSKHLTLFSKCLDTIHINQKYFVH